MSVSPVPKLFGSIKPLAKWLLENHGQRVHIDQLDFSHFCVPIPIPESDLPYPQTGWQVQPDKDGFLQIGEGPNGPTLACRREYGFRLTKADVYISSLVDDSDVSDDESDDDEE
jgi:hypothetical protein